MHCSALQCVHLILHQVHINNGNLYNGIVITKAAHEGAARTIHLSGPIPDSFPPRIMVHQGYLPR